VRQAPKGHSIPSKLASFLNLAGGHKEHQRYHDTFAASVQELIGLSGRQEHWRVGVIAHSVLRSDAEHFGVRAVSVKRKMIPGVGAEEHHEEIVDD
jgi:hypothetical protein